MTCLGCGAALTKRHQKVFCSNRCQRAMERAANVARWLETGEGHPGSGVGHYIRGHVLGEQHGLCAICGCPAEWNGSELRFVLDHVDGDSTNNARANLRLICPNCDSQLPTFKARNRGKGRAWRRQRYADGKSY
ncbi:HNH endonuclease signature motif containing protein [Nocardioides currus]|uniref:HNH endonuclease n=1 Tax=Nocardioides currus TaxID=2133958 RepID=A0A2R7YYZ7_9ACTN|nr:HNH endonuclease signature motif containing protein [Nocardioides currus]PUA81583.1 HNH endonuclease [Nocardioides currus]